MRSPDVISFERTRATSPIDLVNLLVDSLPVPVQTFPSRDRPRASKPRKDNRLLEVLYEDPGAPESSYSDSLVEEWSSSL